MPSDPSPCDAAQVVNVLLMGFNDDGTSTRGRRELLYVVMSMWRWALGLQILQRSAAYPRCGCSEPRFHAGVGQVCGGAR